MANFKDIMAMCLDGGSYAAISATLGCSNRDIAKTKTLIAGARPRRIRLTGQQTQCRTAHRTRRLRHAPTPAKRHTWHQRVVDRIRGPAAGLDKASCPTLPPSRNPALPPFCNTPTNKPLSAVTLRYIKYAPASRDFRLLLGLIT